VSVDTALMQPISTMPASVLRVAVVRAHCDWTDVGSWEALSAFWGGDDTGNASLGKALPIDTLRSIVYAPERLVVMVGVHDLIVVDSPDALLVCARERAQDVRKVRDELKKRGWLRYA